MKIFCMSKVYSALNLRNTDAFSLYQLLCSYVVKKNKRVLALSMILISILKIFFTKHLWNVHRTQEASVFSTAAQNHLSSSVVVFIKVLDINDNVPRLARDYQPYICEGTQAGKVCILWRTDVHDLLKNIWAVRISMKVVSKITHLNFEYVDDYD